ncbi:MAG: urocanate hydratase, partial [Chloroflexota bacterium]
AFDAIVRELRRLENDETLLVQSGKPVGVVRTHEWAPRVLIANSNLVGKWANWKDFRELEQLGLMMYGQMTAGSWIYIGTQGILQGTYETFAELARRHFGGSLKGRIVLTAGLGGMGGAQPLAVTMNDGVCLAIEVDEARAARRHDIGYVDRLANDPATALAMARDAAAKGQAISIALVGNAAEIEPMWAKAGEHFDVVTDQTSAHDALVGYVPAEISLEDANLLREHQPDEYTRRSTASMAAHVRAMLDFKRAGAVVFDYGNNLRAQA